MWRKSSIKRRSLKTVGRLLKVAAYSRRDGRYKKKDVCLCADILLQIWGKHNNSCTAESRDSMWML